MTQKDKVIRLFDKLNENDQKKAYEYMQSLAHSREKANHEGVSKIFGKQYYIVSD